MALYIQFLGWSTGYNPRTHRCDLPPQAIPLCGSDGLVRVDGRLKLDSVVDLAFELDKRRPSPTAGFYVFRGELRSTQETVLYRYEKKREIVSPT